LSEGNSSSFIKLDAVKLKRDVSHGSISVENDGHAVKQITPAGVFHKLILECLDASGNAVTVAKMKAGLTLIEIEVNNETIIELSPTALAAIEEFHNEHNGVTMQDGYIHIPFTPAFVEPNARELYALGMQYVTSFSIKLTYSAAVETDISTINLRSKKTNESKPFGSPMGVYTIIRAQESTSSLGNQEITTLPKNKSNELAIAYHFELQSSHDITKYSFRDGTSSIRKNITKGLNTDEMNRLGKKVQAGYFPIFLGGNNTIGQMLPLSIKEPVFEVVHATTAPGSYDIYMERIKDAPVQVYAK